MKKAVIVATLFVFGLSSCTTDAVTGEKKVSSTAKGITAGAVVGAGVGLLTGKDAKSRRKNALIGAGIGTVAGGSVGGYMDYQESKLRKELQSTGVQIKREGNTLRLVMPGNITFASGSSVVNTAFYPTLDSVAKVLVEYPKTYVNVVGYTDSQGTAAVNNKLSLDRAKAVSGYLTTKKVQTERFVVEGAGSANPIAANTTAAGREQNRRVEISIEPITK